MTNDKIANKIKIGIPALHARLQQKANQPPAEAVADNRIALMVDCSGSMSSRAENKAKIEHLRDALVTFLDGCDFGNTALALEPFPGGDDDDYDLTTQMSGINRLRVAMTSVHPFLMTTIMSLKAGGGTPMDFAMRYALKTYSMTRGIIVSDGQANMPHICIELAHEYKEAGIPVDTVHIGTENHGVDLLQEIAEITGGIFIKFTDVSNFGKNFKFLTPNLRLQLSAGNAAQLIGATEVKK